MYFLNQLDHHSPDGAYVFEHNPFLFILFPVDCNSYTKGIVKYPE